MDVRDLKKIVQIMNDNDLAEVVVEEEGRKLKVRKHETRGVEVVASAVPAPVAGPAPAPPQTPATDGPAPDDASVHVITAPMVGTYYSSPSPESAAYVETGGTVGPETVVCILEAMKVMNEIKAECAGTVVEVCVENGQAVDYGQPLFKVKKP